MTIVALKASNSLFTSPRFVCHELIHDWSVSPVGRIFGRIATAVAINTLARIYILVQVDL